MQHGQYVLYDVIVFNSLSFVDLILTPYHFHITLLSVREVVTQKHSSESES